MKWNDLRSSSNVEDRRGSAGGGGGGRRAGGFGIGAVVIALIVSYFTGINPMTLLGGLQVIDGVTQSSPQSEAGKTGTPDDRLGQFVAKVLGSTEDVWTDIFKQQGASYRTPSLVMFSGMTRSACGTAQSAMGPFYCPNDNKVYLDTAFFDEMRSRFKACPAGGANSCEFAQAYVVAHEIGHHVQNLLGILPKVNEARNGMSEKDSNALSVRVELQADCFAGVWANKAQARASIIEEGDIPAAMQTASAIGDDMLQKRSQGYVVPDSFTHGTSEQRQRWFLTGLKSGQLNACNTFQAQQL